MDPIPVTAFLVPEHPSATPDGFTRVDAVMTRGLPHVVALDKTTRATVVLPSGLAREWRDADPASLVSASDDEHAPSTPDPAAPAGDVRRAPVRLVVERGGVVLGTIPLAAGVRRFVPNGGGADGGVAVELLVIGWELRAGTVRGAGDFGSRIALAWRAADHASAEFAPPPINADLARRLAQTGGLTTGRS